MRNKIVEVSNVHGCVHVNFPSITNLRFVCRLNIKIYFRTSLHVVCSDLTCSTCEARWGLMQRTHHTNGQQSLCLQYTCTARPLLQIYSASINKIIHYGEGAHPKEERTVLLCFRNSTDNKVRKIYNTGLQIKHEMLPVTPIIVNMQVREKLECYIEYVLIMRRVTFTYF